MCIVKIKNQRSSHKKTVDVKSKQHKRESMKSNDDNESNANEAVVTEVNFPSSDPTCQLCGDLTLPPLSSSKVTTASDGESETAMALLPAIVVVNGSGDIDRYGNVPSMKMEFNTANQFAHHMAEKKGSSSIAVLSYDKRGVGKSSKPDDKHFYYRAGMMDLVKDVVEAVKFLAGHPQIDKTKIMIMGHSEGAIIMPLICNEVSRAGLDPIFGCIFYAGFGENLPGALAYQREKFLNEVKFMPGLKGWILRKLATKERIEKKFDDFLKKANAEDDPEYISKACGLSKQPAKWFREHWAYDVNDALEKYIACHCLAITGQKDFQVRNKFCDPEKAAKIVPNAKSIETHRLINLTHALRSMEGDAKIMNMKQDYVKMGKMPLDEELLSITGAWCDRILCNDR